VQLAGELSDQQFTSSKESEVDTAGVERGNVPSSVKVFIRFQIRGKLDGAVRIFAD
jgi:hypothetical protein